MRSHLNKMMAWWMALAAAFVAGGAGADSTDSEGSYRFQRIGEASGISANVITAAFRDRRGLLWIGTREGLLLYDGYTARRFTHEPEMPGSISDNSIRTIFQDSSGRMWFGTNTGGLCHLDPGAEDFSCLRPDATTTDSLSHESVYGFSEDRDGRIWVATQDGLNLLDPTTGKVRRVPFSNAHPAGTGVEYVSALTVDRSGTLWVGTVSNGVYRKPVHAETFEYVGEERGYRDSSAFSFLEDSAGNLWAGGVRWLMVRRAGEEQFTSIDLASYSDDDVVSISALAESDSGHILAASFGDGLFEIDPVTLGIAQYRHVPGDNSSLAENRLTAVVRDAGGGYVVGTWGGGLQRTTTTSRLISSIDEFIDSTGVLSSLVDVETLNADGQGGVWAGSFSNGLLQIEESSSRPELLSVPLGDLNSPTSVVRVLPELPGKVWVGATWGLIDLNPVSLAMRRFVHDPTDPRSLGNGWVTALLRDNDGDLWIGTGGSGLWHMSASESLLGFQADAAHPESLSGDYITALAMDEFGYIWVATRSHGVSRCSLPVLRCRTFDPTVGSGAGLQHHYVTSFFLDRSGDWWVGTAGGGLHRASRLDDGTVTAFERFGFDSGLLDDTVVSLLEDDDGSLWLGTRRGLLRLSPDRSRVSGYIAGDGLISNVFNRGAAARTDKRLYFGTVQGIAYLPAGTPFEASEPAPLVFTHAHNLTTGRAMGGINWLQSTVTVNRGEVLQFAFAILDYEGENHHYAYRLGERGEWVNLESSHQITFGDLPPGDHDLQVRGWSARGVMSQASLPIIVVPPFWMTHWFRIIVFLTVILLALGAHNLRMAGLRRRNQELQRLHKQRERALQKLQQSEAEVSEAARGLRRLASRLETAKEEERQHISRELHDELGQTLTAAKISLQMLQNDAGLSGDKLQSAVGMMDSMIRQVRAISLNLRPPLLDEAGLVPALKSELKQISRQTGIPVDLEIEGDIPPEMGRVATVVFRVVQEAVSNSLRHSGAEAISVNLACDESDLMVVVSDDGCGFDVEEVRERALRGEHLGLLGMDERVVAIGGTIKLESEPGVGTLLRIRIPVRE